MILCFRFGAFVLDVAEGRLYRNGRHLPVGRRALALLQALLESPGRPVSRAMLQDRVWPGRFVEETNLAVQVSALRKVVGAEAIATAHGFGYQLTLPVEAPGQERRGRQVDDAWLPPRSNLGDHCEPLTSFVGRTEALAALNRSLPAARLITLVGAGGIGKTRLALHWAESLAPSQIILVVDVARANGERQLDDALARVVERRRDAATPWRDTLPRKLSGRSACLLLDNCEHLAAECARLADEVTALCPTLKVIATSRVRLYVPFETVFEVPPLAVPPLAGAAGPSEATDLFAERARSLVKVPLSPEESAHAARICRSVDGVPLAIELAAAWLPLLPLRDIAGRLEDDLRLLDAGPAPPSRHSTMDATIRWSYQMLAADEQAAFRRLAVFTGGCTVEAALAVIGSGDDEYAFLRCIARLQDFSLLLRKRRRLAMLEPVRQFAAAELARSGEAAEIEQRHVRFYAALAERFRLSDRSAHLALLNADQGNLLLAQQRSLRMADPRPRLELVVALYEYWTDTGQMGEAVAFAEAALAQGGSQADAELRGAAHMVASRYAYEQADMEGALRHAEQALFVARAAGDTRRTINALDTIASARFETGETMAALALAVEMRQMALDAGIASHVLLTTNAVGEMERRLGHFGRAAAAFAQVLALAREIRDESAESMTLLNMALLLIGQKDFERLPAVLLDSAIVSQRCGAHRTLPYICRAGAALAAHRGDPLHAAFLLGEAARMMRSMQIATTADDRQLDEAVEAKIRQALGGELPPRHGGGTGPGDLWHEIVAWLQAQAGATAEPAAQATAA